ncbi:nuclear transport factor 2 family protein [Aeromicrobium terrae]|uniref:Nuclear transport factor 2 family protein n=1 Tax=Aeromicrobium terrae TaxID=2498846 RepID=A0A5C8NHK6_9ACTN|nr:nuclear transport factor 2 family protein [Aeromicrobium terrae]TXL57626.1 nuclear transport factor 2 family protein [Aeromicrobium terrae]
MSMIGEIQDAAAAHQALNEALIAQDEAALRRIVGERCRIVGPKGFHIDKEEWIRPHVDHVFEMVTLRKVERVVEEYRDTAVVVELQESECIFEGERIDGAFRVTSVWNRDDGPWQLVALQYTAVAPEAQT